MNRNYFNKFIWKPALETADIAPTRANGMHALRHFYASVQLENGVSPVALAEHMGHADPGYLMRIYGHRMPTADARARAAIDNVFRPSGGLSDDHGEVASQDTLRTQDGGS